MKRQSLVISSSFLLTACLVFSYSFLFTNSSQPPVGHTGSPADNGKTCAKSGCHDDKPAQPDNAGVITLKIGQNNPINDLNGFKYQPNTTYQISINLGNGKPRYGFQMSVLDTNNYNQAGSFALTGSGNTSMNMQGNVEYVGHNNASSTNAFLVDWTSPDAGNGPVIFYVTANRANANDENSGDNIFTKRSIACEQGTNDCKLPTSAFTRAHYEKDFSLSPNPVKKRFSIRFNAEPQQPVQINLLNMSGKKISSLYRGQASGNFVEESFTLETSLAKGMYLVEIIQGSQRSYKKIVKR